jgi:hypothetical protein
MGPHGIDHIRSGINAEYEQLTGRKVKDDFPEWNPAITCCYATELLVVLGARVRIGGKAVTVLKGELIDEEL